MARLASLLLLGAIGASAHPSGHARFHKQRSNQERAIGDTIHAVIDGVAVSWVQTEDYGPAATPAIVADKPKDNAIAGLNVAAVATPAPSSAAPSTAPASASPAPATSTSASASSSASSSTGEGITVYTSFTDICKAAKAKRATLDQIKYAGNTGASSGDYGCNKVLLANADLADLYNNTARFVGASEDLYCLVWNKIGADGGINGFFGADATTFKLAAGSEQYVAFDKNSQGGGACFKGTGEDAVEKTTYGAIAGTWAEWDFENESNNGWSGYDASAIVAQGAGLPVTGMSICADNAPSAPCSTITSGGSSFVNAYRAVDADADGIGGQVSGPMKIKIDLSNF